MTPAAGPSMGGRILWWMRQVVNEARVLEDAEPRGADPTAFGDDGRYEWDFAFPTTTTRFGQERALRETAREERA
jgi:hypothetical protein